MLKPAQLELPAALLNIAFVTFLNIISKTYFKVTGTEADGLDEVEFSHGGQSRLCSVGELNVHTNSAGPTHSVEWLK